MSCRHDCVSFSKRTQRQEGTLRRVPGSWPRGTRDTCSALSQHDLYNLSKVYCSKGKSNTSTRISLTLDCSQTPFSAENTHITPFRALPLAIITPSRYFNEFTSSCDMLAASKRSGQTLNLSHNHVIQSCKLATLQRVHGSRAMQATYST